MSYKKEGLEAGLYDNNGTMIKSWDELTDEQIISEEEWIVWKANPSELIGSLIILDSIVYIMDNAFYGCESLTTVAIPDTVTQIGARTFSGCTSLTTVTIPDTVTFIGDEAFCGCESLTTVTIPDAVTFMGNEVFYGCESLTVINIPAVLYEKGVIRDENLKHLSDSVKINIIGEEKEVDIVNDEQLETESEREKDTLSLENIINNYENVVGLLAEKRSLQLDYEEASLSYESIIELGIRMSQIDYELSSYGEAQLKISRDLSNYDSCFSVKNVFDKFSEQIMKVELSEKMLLDICNMDKVLDASMGTKEELDVAVDKYIADCNQKIGEVVQGEHMKTEAVDKQEQEKVAKQEKELQEQNQNQNEEIVQHRLRRHR